MKLPLGELPGDLLHTALLALRAQAGAGQRTIRAEQSIRRAFDEGASRLGLIARLVTEMGGGAVAALSIDHAGAAVFLTALALAADEERDHLVLAASDSRVARLVLSLRAAGLKSEAVEEQFLLLHPDRALPREGHRIDADRARALLAAAADRA